MNIFSKNAFIPKVWRLLGPFHKQMYLIFVITALFEFVRMGGPYLFGKILDLLITTNGMITWQTALWVVAGLALVRIISLTIDYATDLIIGQMLFKTERYISTVSFAKLLELSLDYHEKVNTGAKINIVNKGTDKLINLIDSITFVTLPIILQLFFSVLFLSLTNWVFGIIFALSLIPFTLVTFHIQKTTSKLREKRHDAYEISSSEIGDTITNISVVKAFAQEKREFNSFQSLWDLIRSISMKEFKKHIYSGYGRSLLIEAFYVTLLIVGLFEVRNGSITVGTLVFLINLMERAYSNIFRLGRIYDRVVDASESVDRITNLMQQNPSVINAAKSHIPEKVDGAITFDKVSFSYDKNAKTKVLDNVSFTIPAGSFTALVGKSGSGKSTIAKLLSRYYDPISGSIMIDNTYNLKDFDLDHYRKQTAVVFQDSPVPNRKVWEVIAYSAGKTSWNAVKDQVIKAAKLASADEFITDFSDGYQTKVGERGVKLSGGQKQRLAIARALFADPKILIMDEPTSHLDTLSEAMIQKALEQISNQRSLTKIVIAHRLSTVAHADQILVMQKGRLVEKGTHAELIKKGGVYAQIVAQSELKS